MIEIWSIAHSAEQVVRCAPGHSREDVHGTRALVAASPCWQTTYGDGRVAPHFEKNAKAGRISRGGTILNHKEHDEHKRNEKGHSSFLFVLIVPFVVSREWRAAPTAASRME